MGGICGWIGTGKTSPPGVGPAMTGALSHRGRVEWLDWRSDGATAADGSSNSHETIVAEWSAWMRDPAAFASRLEGAFAVAALDRAGGRLVLARDRLGEKPLYYTAGPTGVAFASEIKALRAAGVVADLSLSPEALDAYLAFTYVPAPRTIFSAVHKVPAGHCVVFDLRGLAEGSPGATETNRYWKLPDRNGADSSPEEMLGILRD
ncbi:MAG TPA: hypothetical protein VFG76_05975, partial [Candidatus Polarisedimenticolia bacterium]|nr:hypothetical protein [Candidatus Polarisedimenticolia bacterium]